MGGRYHQCSCCGSCARRCLFGQWTYGLFCRMFFGLDCAPAKCPVCAGSFASTTDADLYQQCRLAGHASKVGNKHCLVAHIYIYTYIYIICICICNTYTKSTWNFAPQMVRCCESVWGQQLRWKCTQHFLVGTWNTRIHMLWTLRTLRWFFHWGKALCADLQKVFDQDCKTKNICCFERLEVPAQGKSNIGYFDTRSRGAWNTFETIYNSKLKLCGRMCLDKKTW